MSNPSTPDNAQRFEQILDNLGAITSQQFHEFLRGIGAGQTQDDWSELFYEIEELAESGQSAHALELLETCLEFADHVDDAWARSSARYFQGNVHILGGQADAAVRSYEAIIEGPAECDSDDDLTAAAMAWHAIAGVRMSQGRLPEAIAAAEQALAIDRDKKCVSSQIEDLLTLANLHLTHEDFSRAEADANQAIALATSVSDPMRLALAYSMRGDIQGESFELTDALSSFDRALEVLQGIEDRDDLEIWYKAYASNLGSRAMLFNELGRYHEATRDYAQAARMSHAIEDTRNQVQYLTWMGSNQRASERSDLAIRSFSAAERLCESVGFDAWIVTIHLHRAHAFRDGGGLDEAETSVRFALDLLREIDGESDVDEGLCLMHLGDISMDRAGFETAAAHYAGAAELFSNGEVGAMHRRVLGKLGSACRRLGDLPRAYDTLKQAIAVYEDKRQTLSRQTAQIEFGSSRDEIYDDLVLTCLALNYVTEAFLVTEENKGRVLREELARQQIVETKSALPFTEVIQCLRNE